MEVIEGKANAGGEDVGRRAPAMWPGIPRKPVSARKKKRASVATAFETVNSAILSAFETRSRSASFPAYFDGERPRRCATSDEEFRN
jgi:hypothetical protein